MVQIIEHEISVSRGALGQFGGALSAEQLAKRAAYEVEVEAGLAAMVRSLEALRAIHDEHLYADYGTWDTYCQTRWKFSGKHAKRRLAFLSLLDGLGDIPDTDKPTTERQARLLRQIDMEADRIRAAQVAASLAKAEGEKPAQRHYEKAVHLVQREVSVRNRYAVIAHMLASGELSVDEASRLADAVDALKPQARGVVIQMMAKHGLRNPELVAVIGAKAESDIIARKNNKPTSLTLKLIDESGKIGNSPMRTANLNDWREQLAEAKLGHIVQSESYGTGKLPRDPVSVWLFPDSPEKSVKNLATILTADELSALAKALQKALD